MPPPSVENLKFCPTKTQMKTDQLWNAVLTELQLTVPPSRFAVLFSQTFILSQKEKGKTLNVNVASPHLFGLNAIRNQYLAKIASIISRLTGKKANIQLSIHSKPNASFKKTKTPLFDYQQTSADIFKEALEKALLKPAYSFENFAVSPTNEVAYAAAMAVAQKPGSAYNPLFLYGDVGVGKTHLMQAVAQEILKKSPQTPLIYRMGEEFTNEIIEAIRNKKTNAFKAKYRSSNVLLIDDVQFIAGKTHVQEEFFHTFNALHGNGGQIVLTSDRPPAEIKLLESRLRSRFEGGLIIDIQEPNFELRTAILLIKAQQLKLSLPMDVAQLIANHISSTRKLEGFLVRLEAEIKIRNRSCSPDLVSSLLDKPKSPIYETRPLVRPKEVVEAIANHFNLRQMEIKGKARSRKIVVPRQLAMYLLRKDLNLTLVEIGHFFGGKDHTTVMHSVDKMRKQLSQSEGLRLDLSQIRKRLYSQ